MRLTFRNASSLCPQYNYIYLNNHRIMFAGLILTKKVVCVIVDEFECPMASKYGGSRMNSNTAKHMNANPMIK